MKSQDHKRSEPGLPISLQNNVIVTAERLRGRQKNTYFVQKYSAELINHCCLTTSPSLAQLTALSLGL